MEVNEAKWLKELGRENTEMKKMLAMASMESTADALINALALGSIHPMSPEAIRELEKEFLT